MSNPILTNWSKEDGEVFSKRLLVTEHNLHKRKMFSDDGLAELLDRYPREEFGLYTMDNSAYGTKESFRSGLVGNLNGEEILEAVKRGLLWINLRNANHHLKDYADLCDEMFGELESNTPGLKTRKRDLGVLISSPNARVFYHLDIPLVTLWQIKGEKTLYVYPTGSPFIKDEQLEGIVLQETEEEIDYRSEFDSDAEVVKMKPGVMAAWPQNAPHRIDNGDCINVSLSCEYMTLPALVRANALYTNGVLRRRYGRNPEIGKDGVVAQYAKAALARVYKLAGNRSSFKQPIKPSFTVDLDAENAVRDLSAA